MTGTPIPVSIADAAPVPSPCVDVCRMHDAAGLREGGLCEGALCEGCARTLDEIARWSVMSDDDKRAVWVRLPARRERLDVLLGRRGPEKGPRP